ncbi:hypothetical protein OGAPHI_002948 [Ogataea philodendri]|uniref:Uncharacterized protein n=1 Tax=Ogataea philodendri TaxID=1378263 RepID=A0A9P8P9B8_9ASCO|nr:uncharacterized protein OGAPHI_002948 [Ogataea philodendri]KAH3667299.1 hypothetical protein OGAPHI_002948 [Ogataea philodendri]
MLSKASNSFWEPVEATTLKTESLRLGSKADLSPAMYFAKMDLDASTVFSSLLEEAALNRRVLRLWSRNESDELKTQPFWWLFSLIRSLTSDSRAALTLSSSKIHAAFKLSSLLTNCERTKKSSGIREKSNLVFNRKLVGGSTQSSPSFRLVVDSENTGGVAVDLEEIGALHVQSGLFLVQNNVVNSRVGLEVQKDREHGLVVLWLDITGGEESLLRNRNLTVLLRNLHQWVSDRLGPNLHGAIHVLTGNLGQRVPQSLGDGVSVLVLVQVVAALETHVGCKTLVQPQRVPKVHGTDVTKPLVGQFVGHNLGNTQLGGVTGLLANHQVHHSVGDQTPILHGSGSKVVDTNHVHLWERVWDIEYLFVVLEGLGGQLGRVLSVSLVTWRGVDSNWNVSELVL